jgi:LysR family nitrogen assimilation transcriptional regulator
LQIRTLEQELGVPLLVRHSRGVAPTGAGQVLYERACEILKLIQATRSEVSGMGAAGQESISIGLTPGVMNLIGREMLVGSREGLPNVNLSLVEEMSYVLIDALEREEIDAALAYSVPERPWLVRLPVVDEELLLVTAPTSPVARRKGSLKFSEAMRRPLVLAKVRDSLRVAVIAAADSRAVSTNIAYEASSIAVMKNVVASGAADSVMPFGTVHEDVKHGRLATRRIEDPRLSRTLYFVRSSRRGRFNNERALLDFVRDAILQMTKKLGALASPLPSLVLPFPEEN